MILKIQDPNIAGKWWWFDKIDKLSVNSREFRVKEIPYNQGPDGGEGKRLIIVYDNPNPASENTIELDITELQMLDEAAFADGDNSVRVCNLRFENHEEYTMALSGKTQAYLLNDEGRTIERL